MTLDANGDGQLTYTDVLERAWALFFLPGDLCLYVLSTRAAPLARWLELGPGDYHGFVSGVVSVCAWFVAFTMASIAYHYVLDVDRKVTSATRRLLATLALRVRIGHALLRQRWRTRLAARRTVERDAPVRAVELSVTEFKVLELHAGLAAGYSLSVTEVADTLRAHVHATREILNGLKELGLLNRAVGNTDHETTYTLSSAGRALLASLARRRRAHSPTHG
jgi:hypothetical protein